MGRCQVGVGVYFGGIHFDHPFVLPSAQPTRTEEMVTRALAYGWAGAVMPTVTPGAVQFPMPRPGLGRVRYGGVDLGIGNVEPTSDVPIEVMAERITRLSALGRPVLASFSAAFEPAPWANAARVFEAAGAAGIELNVSTPHALPEAGLGAAIGNDPDRVAHVVTWVTESCSIPVWVKLPPLPHMVADLAAAAHAGGALAVTLTNNLPAIIGVDLVRRVVLPAMQSKGTIGAIAGASLAPVALACVASVARSVPGIDVAACGGVVDVDSSLAFLALGAGLLQVYTPVLEYGYPVLETLLDGLRAWLSEHGETLTGLRGSALTSLTTWREFAAGEADASLAQVDPARCIQCGRCSLACRDAGFQAITGAEGSLPVVDWDACTGCGLCEAICPAPGAITLRT